jgi:structural maintenance of chromosome 4
MRQGKLSELIHNSEDWPDLDYCNVEVWFKEIIDLVRLALGSLVDGFH